MDIQHGPDVGFIPAANSDAIDTSPNSTSVNYRLWLVIFSYTNQLETELTSARQTKLHTCTTVNQIKGRAMNRG